MNFIGTKLNGIAAFKETKWAIRSTMLWNSYCLKVKNALILEAKLEPNYTSQPLTKHGFKWFFVMLCSVYKFKSSNSYKFVFGLQLLQNIIYLKQLVDRECVENQW